MALEECLTRMEGTVFRSPATDFIPSVTCTPCGEKTRAGHGPEQQLFAQRPSMINQAREVFCPGRFPASLLYALIVSPSPAVPSTFTPLPSCNTSAGRPVVLGTALLPSSSLSPAV